MSVPLDGLPFTQCLDKDIWILKAVIRVIQRYKYCQTQGMNWRLVSTDQMLNKSYVMKVLDGRARVVPAAEIQVDTKLICDLIIGNIVNFV